MQVILHIKNQIRLLINLSKRIRINFLNIFLEFPKQFHLSLFLKNSQNATKNCAFKD